MNAGIKAKKVILENFRNYKGEEFLLGDKITIISGQNGVGKSNLLSLIASGSGLSKKAALGSNFQPEFNEFFYIDPNENYKDYKIFIQYASRGKHDMTRRLSFQDYSKTNRGIRIIPRTSTYGTNKKQKEIEAEVKAEYGIGGAARVGIPTIYLSLSRLYPLGEKYSTTVSVKKINKRNALCQEDVREKFKTWYNAVIPDSIKEDADIKIVKKTASPRASLHMDIMNTPTLSQSIGQDNVGNIISALVDIYLLSKEEDYKGALLCIDEIDVSLHPDTQVKMIELIDELADELKIQFVLSTHSLTFIKKILEKEKKNNEDYKVIYVKNPLAPLITTQNLYESLKADMFGSTTFLKPKVRTYFEDDVTQKVFGLLVDSFRKIYNEIIKDDENMSTPVLRNASSVVNYKEINERIRDFRGFIDVKDNIREIPVYLGCEELAKLNENDSFFRRVMIILDGDARIKNGREVVKPEIKDYLNKEYQLESGQSERKHENNVCFLPDYFAPESFLYRIIYQTCNDAIKYKEFWKSVDAQEDTTLYTADKVKQLFSNLSDDYKNGSLKDIFEKHNGPNNQSEVWFFINNTDIVRYYYFDYNTIGTLIEFMEKVRSAYKMAYDNMMADKY